MEVIKVWLDCVMKVLNLPINLFGYTISMWSIYVASMLLAIFVGIIKRMIGGGD